MHSRDVDYKLLLNVRMTRTSLLCCSWYCLAVQVLAGVQPLRDIRYALFTSGPEGDFDSSGAIPAIELAEEEIFNDPSILVGYSLTHTPIKDTQCNRTRSLDLFFASVVQATPPVLGLLGCGCSVASEPIAEIIHHWNISQIAYSSSAVTLSNRQRFVNFFRTYPSDVSLAPAVPPFLQFFGWKRIIFITQEQSLFTSIYQNLFPVLEMNNVLVRNRMVSSYVQTVLTSLRQPDFFFPEDDIRVIFVNTHSSIARFIMCEALRSHGIVGYPQYVWITYAWYQEEWWTSAVNDDPIRCDEEELIQLLRLSIAIQTVPIADNPDAATEVGLTANDFFREYARLINMSASAENNYTFSFIAPIAYDAVWSFALALNRTITMLEWPKERIIRETMCEDDGTNLDRYWLDDFNYSHNFVGCIVRWSLAQTDFAGVSGQVSYNENGTRLRNQITVMQYRDTNNGISLVTLGYSGRDKNFTFEYINSLENDTVFPDGVPSDGIPIFVALSYNLALVVAYDFISFLGIIFSIVCLLFNIVFRKRKIIRLTSPSLNYIITFGAFIMYCSILVRLIPSTDAQVNYLRCHIQGIMGNLAYLLVFGTILAKMGRIYRIFRNPSEQNIKGVSDWHLAIIVFIITGVGTLIPVVGWVVLNSVPSLELDLERGPDRDDRGVKIVYQVWQCTAKNNANIINITIFVFEAILQIIGVILAFQTRRVKIRVLNDYVYVSSIIYISTITIFCTAAITVALGALLNITEVAYSGALLIATTCLLGLTFIPKMVSLYRDPNGEKIFTDQHPATISMDMAIPGGHGKPKEQGNQSKAVIIDGNQSNGLAVKNNQSDGQLTRNESDKQPLKVSQTGATKGKELKEEPKKLLVEQDTSARLSQGSRFTSKTTFTELYSVDEHEFSSGVEQTILLPNSTTPVERDT